MNDPEIGKQVLAIHNKKFKNSEKFERYNYRDYIVKEITFLEVDCTSEINNVFLEDSTNNDVQTTDKSNLELLSVWGQLINYAWVRD